MLPIKTVLHPTDFSERSDQAFHLACNLASDYGANLVILHVVRMPILLGDGVMMPSVSAREDVLRDKLLSLEVPDQVDVIRKLEEGNPAAEILQLAQLCHADLIVMGTHGRRGLQRLVMGSVAEEVVRRAACPVLTVAAPTTPANADKTATSIGPELGVPS
jgi:nucleotide-binding universal stress UspA family protein